MKSQIWVDVFVIAYSCIFCTLQVKKLSCRWRDCFSDEHYFATLLAVLGRENETDCKGFMMHVDWSRGGAHPRTYELREISAAR